MKKDLNSFINDMEATVRKCTTESEILRRAKPLLGELLRSQDSMPQESFKPRKDRFANNLIYMPDDKIFSVIGGVFLPGQATPIHDHFTWALIGMYEGEERESYYRRMDDGSNPKIAIIKKASERINKKGHVTVLGKTGIHRIENVSDKSSLSVHVYGLDIGNTQRNAYNPVTGEIGNFVSGYDSVLRNLSTG
ncbi:cysteine dioxygenase [Methanosarcinales archaeon]|nr:cysteine dioxygenase [Methanosarcinales archaeon]